MSDTPSTARVLVYGDKGCDVRILHHLLEQTRFSGNDIYPTTMYTVATKLLRNMQFHVVILDHRLTNRVDGADLIPAVVSLNPSFRNIICSDRYKNSPAPEISSNYVDLNVRLISREMLSASELDEMLSEMLI